MALKIRVLIVLITVFTGSVFGRNGVEISSYMPVIPMFKGENHNQLLRLTIYVPEHYKTFNLNELTGTLNDAGAKHIQQLDVFYNGYEPNFSTQNKIISVPARKDLKIKVDLNLKPGLHYIWFSASLEPLANIDDVVEFKIIEAMGEQNQKITIKPISKQYSKRIGIVVKKANEDNIHTFRIPGITTTGKGTLIAVYDIRYKHAGDLPANIDVGMSRSKDGGRTWEPMKIIMDMGEPHDNNGVGDPAILYDPVNKKIWVIALWSKGNKSIAGSKPGLSEDETGQLVLVSSSDDGLTWSKPKSITAGVKNPKWNLFFNGPGGGIVTADGKLVFAAQYWDENAIPHSTLIYSSDGGITWITENGPKSNTTEAQIVETQPGTLMLNMRDNRGAFRSIAVTKDYGKTWKEHRTSYSALPDPVCMASFIKEKVSVKGMLKDIVFFGNDNTPSGRYNLTIKASLDLAETWNPKNELLIDERKLYGYSALTKIDDKTLGFFYEGIRDLYFVRIPVDEIIK